LLLLLVIPLGLDDKEATATVTIRDSGVVTVEINGPVVTGLNTFQAPVTPILTTVLAEVNGEPAPPIYVNRTIIVPANSPGAARITYIANVTLIDGRAEFRFESEIPALLRVERGVILLTLPDIILETRVVEGVLEIRFQGPAKLAYVLEAAVKPAALEEEEAPPSAEVVEEPPPASPLSALTPYILGGVAGALIVALYLWRRYRGLGLKEAIELDEVDRAILERLLERKGVITQGELYRVLDLPKTTIWRHVRRLAGAGYLAIEPIGRTNRLRLLRRPPPAK
jgi:uncharacterized membrane protein